MHRRAVGGCPQLVRMVEIGENTRCEHPHGVTAPAFDQLFSTVPRALSLPSTGRTRTACGMWAALAS
jgi:hypothetical protein